MSYVIYSSTVHRTDWPRAGLAALTLAASVAQTAEPILVTPSDREPDSVTEQVALPETGGAGIFSTGTDGVGFEVQSGR